MGAPDGEIPEMSITFDQLSGMADYTQEALAQDRNAEMAAIAEEARLNFLNGILGGFLNVIAGISAAIEDFISDLVYALKGITGGFIDLTGYFQDEHDTLTDTTTVAYNAYSAATTAQSTAEDAVSDAEAAANAAAAAQETADTAYNLASYWEAECVVASAEVLLGVNELLIGLCQNVPTGQTRKITDLHIALENQPGGMSLQTKKWNAAGTSSSVIHTATLGANVTRINYNNLDLDVADKERVFWNASSITGSTPPNVLQCLLFGVIL